MTAVDACRPKKGVRKYSVELKVSLVISYDHILFNNYSTINMIIISIQTTDQYGVRGN